MNLLFEEDGVFRAGSVLSSTEASHQVELASGKRAKVKSAHVLLHFDDVPAARLLEAAQAEADLIDLDFLWEAAPQQEFAFGDLAVDYFGGKPTSIQQAALLFRLHSAPVYFHRKGRGRYRPAPPETLRAALAAVERKRRQDELRQQYVDELKAGRAPAAIAEQAVTMLVRPDRSTIEFKALEQAAGETRTTPLRLLLATGAITSAYRWHVDSFLAQHFARGTGFPAELPSPGPADALPLAEVAAFSIDDSATTEIDDAFSVTPIGESRVQVGVHIAAPALALARGHGLDAVARGRMSTVYAPGLKITMLPQTWIDAYSLTEGQVVPVLSLYIDLDTDAMEVLRTESRVERVRIAGNLRHDRLDDVITEESIADGRFDAPFAAELSLLWRFARALLARREAVRGRPEALGRVEYAFELDGDGEHAHVSVKPRRRGAPLDLLVAELMIYTNSTWGRWLAERGVAGIYRSQSLGRVRMSTVPAAHEGMGVSHYAWSSSPLRRYVDLVNQRQLIACVRDEAPPYGASDADLFAVVSSFDAAYVAYAEFQERMERYWGLRWLRQEDVRRIEATVIRGDVLRLTGIPFITRLPGLPELPRGQHLELEVLGGDDVDLTLEARVHRLTEAAAADELDDESADETATGEPVQPPPTEGAPGAS
ncbi:MAG TPA: RNB domain-containing ribonuclease [Burkholderiaceae bacterium]|nr:RNB domain-containing ribonuclease [Burkholderiaceae bacterium]HQR69452.1 RNB domain-containing ribonuclease [Burkholderiaceae bacterium]